MVDENKDQGFSGSVNIRSMNDYHAKLSQLHKFITTELDEALAAPKLKGFVTFVIDFQEGKFVCKGLASIFKGQEYACIKMLRLLEKQTLSGLSKLEKEACLKKLSLVDW